ncbi:unnamed protein product [Brassicogethes aeneus]|uniref:Uncharacterized protein n=1 Tax=Brassicogethes aeneus TaxID=1431903 RepID=A0A9P0AS27_BRAAE|nr:unnamed protein product [Brassicogethes aeneus]
MDVTNAELKAMMTIFEEVRNIKTGQEKYQAEISALKEENQKLNEKLNKVEKKMEKLEKEKKRNNVIIRGTKGIRELAIQEVSGVLEKMGVDNIEFLKVETIKPKTGKSFIVAHLKDGEMKTKIMQNKSKLKGLDIYIDNDYTEEEQKVQKTIAEYAKNIAKEGRKVKIGYRKLIIDGQKWVWNDETRQLVEIPIEQEECGEGSSTQTGAKN